MPANINVQSAYSPTQTTFTTQGNYFGLNDAAITALAFTSASVTNPRIDLVVATQTDAQYSGATNTWSVQVITGTAAASPVAPAIPQSSYVLAQVAIAANQTAVVNANITDKRYRYNQQPWNLPWGLIGTVSLANSFVQTTSSTTFVDITGMTFTVTAAANRLYVATMHIPIVERDNNVQAVVAITADGTVKQATRWDFGAATNLVVGGTTTTPPFTLSSGSRIIKGQMKVSAAQITVAGESTTNGIPMLMLMDVGPNTVV